MINSITHNRRNNNIYNKNYSIISILPKLLFLLSSQSVLAAPLYEVVIGINKHESIPIGSDEYYIKLAVCFMLVLVGGVLSGLTLGLMGLDMVNLQVLSSSGSETEQKDAVKVLKLLERGRHWVLVCLLLTNVVVNESLPIFLDSVLGGGVRAVVLSTCLIVIFGEVIPQALCARHGLMIGAKCTPFVLALMWIEYPVAYPIAKLLDWMLGETHGTVYKKAELKTFVSLHRTIGEETLNEDEVTIISAVLELSDKPLSFIMTPIEDTYTLSSDVILDQLKVDEILALGHSRIPVHHPTDPLNFCGMLIVKKLISYDPSRAQQISSFPLTVLPETGPDSTCLDALNYFQQGRSHILLVSTTPGREGGAIGVVSLEDVIEEMIGEEIVDETDLYVDLHNKIKVVRGPTKRVAAGKALAPLIQGVIERRQTYRITSGAANNYGATSTTDPSQPQSSQQVPMHVPPPAKAFQGKVVVKGGGVPALRTAFGNRIDGPSDGNTPFGSPPTSTTNNSSTNNSLRGSGTSTPVGGRGRSVERESGNGKGGKNDETRPLLKRNSNDGS